VNPDSPAEIRALLEERGLALKKRWGQNFMVNRGARERLVGLLEPRPGSGVWEIGPGLGSMTAMILERAGALTAFEVDRGLCRFLEETLGGRPGFRLVPGDFLETWRDARASFGDPERVLGNLPYRSASIIISALLEGGLGAERMIFTVQKELAERMTAPPGGKSYSSFSVLCQSCCVVTGRGDLQPGSFWPVPEVVSSVVELRPRENAPRGAALQALTLLTRGLFASRRKTIRNNLAGAGFGALFTAEQARAALEKEGIDPAWRAERIPPETFAAAARGLTGSSSP
jgi:16S rRNA (adenine1518-N6/adenine1519-N6)-dimethyltransferase